MPRKKHSMGDMEGWVLVAGWPWVNHFPFWASVSSLVNKTAESSQVLLFCGVDFDYWGAADNVERFACKATVEIFIFGQEGLSMEEDGGRKPNRWASGEQAVCLPSTRPCPAFLTCYSNQTTLQLKNEKPLPSHSLDFQIKNILQVSKSPAEVM